MSGYLSASVLEDPAVLRTSSRESVLPIEVFQIIIQVTRKRDQLAIRTGTTRLALNFRLVSSGG